MVSPSSFAFNYLLKDLFPFNAYNEMKQNYAVHFMIVHDQVKANFSWTQKRPLPVLEQPNPIYSLTPLHLAIIKGDKMMAEFLHGRGLSLTVIDRRHYTILHHATVCQNQLMLNWIATVDKTKRLAAMRTQDNKTAAHLEQILSYQPLDANQPAFHYLDSSSGKILEGSAGKFQELTGARYTKHTFVTSQSLFETWLEGNSIFHNITLDVQARLNYLRSQYICYEKKPPLVYLARNPSPELGYDVCAGEEIEKHQMCYLIMVNKTLLGGITIFIGLIA